MTTVEELIFRVTADTAKMGNPLAPFQRDIQLTRAELFGLQEQMDEIDGETLDIDVDTSKVSAAIELARENIERLREEVAEQFIIDPTVDTRKAERTIRALEAKIKALTPKDEKGPGEALAEWSETAGKIFDLAARSGVQVVSFIARSIRNVGPAGGVAIAAALAVVLEGALAAAISTVTAGVGLALLTGGIVAALQDEAIKAAASETVADIASEFAELGSGLKGPLLAGLETINEGFERLVANILPAFDQLGGIVDLFAVKIAEAFDELGPGINAALSAAGPILTVLANSLPELAKAFSRLFQVIDAQSDGATLAFKLMLIAIEAAIYSITAFVFIVLAPFQTLAGIIDIVNVGWERMNTALKVLVGLALALTPFAGLFVLIALALGKTTDAAEESTKGIALVGDANAKAAKKAGELETKEQDLAEALRKATEEAARQARVLDDLFNTVFDGSMDMTRSLIDIENGWQSLYKTLREAPVKTLDLDVQAGRDNATAILDQLDIIKRQREAMLRVGGDLLKVNQTFKENLALLRIDLESTGFGGADLDKLLAPFEAIPDKQIIEIQTQWSESANPDIMYAELVKTFGLPVVQKILAEVDLPSTKVAKDFFGETFGDKAKERSMIKIDPEGFQEMKDQLAELEKDPKSVQVTLTAVRDATFAAVDTQLATWEATQVRPDVMPVIEPESYGAVLATLFSLQTPRTVAIVPYIDPNGLDAVTRTLNRLGAQAASIPLLPSNRPVKPEELTASATVLRPRIYIDGNEIRAVIRGEVTQSVSRSTVAPTRYRRLS